MKAMHERNLKEGQWEDRKQWSLGVGQRRKTFWNRYTYIYQVVSNADTETEIIKIKRRTCIITATWAIQFVWLFWEFTTDHDVLTPQLRVVTLTLRTSRHSTQLPWSPWVRTETFALLGCYSVSSGNSLPAFRDNLSVPFQRMEVQEENWADRSYRSVRNKAPIYAVWNPRKRRSHLDRDGSLKLRKNNEDLTAVNIKITIFRQGIPFGLNKTDVN